MPYQTTTPDAASAQLDKGTGAVYLDVRSQREFVSGHPSGAINIPIMEAGPTGQLVLNEEFLQVAEAVLPKDTQLFVGCASGKRSEAACQILQESGFTNLANVAGGFAGARNPLGQVVQQGWSQLGLPVSDDNGEGVSYESLRKKAFG